MSDKLFEMDEDVASVVELLIPWDDAQKTRVIKEGWPTLQELWSHCRKTLNLHPHRLDAQVLAAVLESATNGLHTFSPDAWYQWVRRAKKDIIKDMGKEDWNLLFVPILGPGKERKQIHQSKPGKSEESQE